MLYIILQIIAFHALFLLVYDLFLKRETFFNYNRVYLLVTSILSLVLPFIKLPMLKTMTVKDAVIHLPEVFIGVKPPTEYEILVAEQAGIIIDKPEVPVWQTIVWAGIVVASLFFVFKITKLILLKLKNPKRWQGDVLIVNLIKSTAAFSFFNTIFLGEKIPNSERATIFKHELVHIKEMHTLDLLFFEILKIAMWFNPLVYLYQSRIKELHEFIADAKSAKQQGKSEYYQNLLNQVFDVHNVSFINTFFKKSLIKKRIAMLQKSKSKHLNLVKYALLIPLVLGMLIYTSTEVRAYQKTESNNESNQELTEKQLIKKYYDEIKQLLEDGKHQLFDPEISDKYDYTDKTFVPTKGQYLRYVAYTRHLGGKFKEFTKKSEKTSKKQKERFEAMINFNRSYEEHLKYLKTDEAKRIFNNTKYNRTLKVISDDIDNLTAEQHKDAYEKVVDIFRGSFYEKLEISDNQETVGISKKNYDALVQFFSIDEIKTLLLYLEKDDASTITKKNSIVPFSIIDEVPFLPECKGLQNNEERKKCTSQKVAMHVNSNFNIKIADSLGLSGGKKRIFVKFTIDKKGGLIDIGARAAHPALETEAIRVVKSLPQFIPGKHKEELVKVPYSLPIVFQIADKPKKSKN